MSTGNTEPAFAPERARALPKPPESLPPRPTREAREPTEAAPTKEPTREQSDTTAADFFAGLRRKKPKMSALPQVRDETTVRIEKILEDSVGDAFSRLSPVAKQEFKLKGEETARKIRELLKNSHVKVKKIFRLILEWLKLLPGINRFFLEQEAKIKTDRIIALHKQRPSP